MIIYILFFFIYIFFPLLQTRRCKKRGEDMKKKGRSNETLFTCFLLPWRKNSRNWMGRVRCVSHFKKTTTNTSQMTLYFQGNYQLAFHLRRLLMLNYIAWCLTTQILSKVHAWEWFVKLINLKMWGPPTSKFWRCICCFTRFVCSFSYIYTRTC